MTQQEIIKEIKSFPILEQFKIVEEIQENIKRNLQNSNKTELSVAEKLAIVENLSGALKMENPPVTKQEEREIIAEHLAEKHK